jgi:hypothetical protein
LQYDAATEIQPEFNTRTTGSQRAQIDKLHRFWTAWYRRPASSMERDQDVIEVLNKIVARRPRWGSGSCTTGCGWMAIASTTNACIGCIAR